MTPRHGIKINKVLHANLCEHAATEKDKKYQTDIIKFYNKRLLKHKYQTSRYSARVILETR